MPHPLLAANTSVDDLIGKITPPAPVAGFADDAYGGILQFLNVGLNLVLVVAGIFTLVNFIMAGFLYLTAGGDSKKVQEAQAKITFTVIGLAIIVAAPVLAGIVGLVAFGDWTAVLNPKLIDINGNAL